MDTGTHFRNKMVIGYLLNELAIQHRIHGEYS